MVASRYQIHPYDAAIVAAAQEPGARILCTEELNHGQMSTSLVVKKGSNQRVRLELIASR